MGQRLPNFLESLPTYGRQKAPFTHAWLSYKKTNSLSYHIRFSFLFDFKNETKQYFILDYYLILDQNFTKHFQASHLPKVGKPGLGTPGIDAPEIAQSILSKISDSVSHGWR